MSHDPNQKYGPIPSDRVPQFTPTTIVPDRKDLKWDKGKLQYELILPEFLELMAEILTKGEINHPKVNGQPSWQLVEPDGYKNALWRHFQAYRKDHASLDDNMNTHHMGHIAVNAMFLWWMSKMETKVNENENI